MVACSEHRKGPSQVDANNFLQDVIGRGSPPKQSTPRPAERDGARLTGMGVRCR